MRIRHYRTALAFSLVASTLAACGGANLTSTTPAAKMPSGSSAQTRLRIAIPAASGTPSATKRRPAFVAATTAGVLVQTYAQGDTTHTSLLGQTATDISSGSAACGGQSGTPRTCSIVFDAPGGADTFVVTSYDAAPVNGSFSSAHQLGAASLNQTITAGSANTVSVTLGGVLASVIVALPNHQIRGTVPSTQNAVIEGLDADGNVIVSDGYADATGAPVSITLALSPNTGSVFTLGTTSLAAPSPTGVQVSYNGAAATAFSTTLTAAAGSMHASGAIAVLGPAFTQYPGTASGGMSFISVAPYSSQDQKLWFTEPNANKIGSLAPGGSVVSYPTSGTQPTGIAPSPIGDTHLWYTDYGSSQIEASGTDGVLQGVVSTPTAAAGPLGITAGPDGNMWFTEKLVGKIGRITQAFAVTEYPTLVAGSQPEAIASGPDGNLWFTDPGANEIGNITTNGVVTEYPIPTSASYPFWIAAGPDGKLWFTENGANKIGAISTNGSITEYQLPANSHPTGITAGADGNLWFLENGTTKIAKITTAGTVTEYAIPANGSSVVGIATGPDNNLWFTEGTAAKIGTFAW